MSLRTRVVYKARGVYELPFLSTADERVLVAINRRGQRVAERCIGFDDDDAVAWRDLEAVLDRIDPICTAFRLYLAS